MFGWDGGLGGYTNMWGAVNTEQGAFGNKCGDNQMIGMINYQRISNERIIALLAMRDKTTSLRGNHVITKPGDWRASQILSARLLLASLHCICLTSELLHGESPDVTSYLASRPQTAVRGGSFYQSLNFFEVLMIFIRDPLEQNGLAWRHKRSRLGQALRYKVKGHEDVSKTNKTIKRRMLTSKASSRLVISLDDVASATMCTSYPRDIRSIAVCCTHTWLCNALMMFSVVSISYTRVTFTG